MNNQFSFIGEYDMDYQKKDMKEFVERENDWSFGKIYYKDIK